MFSLVLFPLNSRIKGKSFTAFGNFALPVSKSYPGSYTVRMKERKFMLTITTKIIAIIVIVLYRQVTYEYTDIKDGAEHVMNQRYYCA